MSRAAARNNLLGELREHWRKQWPESLAIWSRFTRLSEPRWCLTKEEEKAERLESSFAMIRLVDHAVIFSLRQVHELQLGRFGREIMSHEIGHHVLTPGDLSDHVRLLARVRAGLPGMEQHAGMVANLFTDLLINDRLQRSARLDLAGLYLALTKGEASRVWTLYMRIYEILWNLPRENLARGSHLAEIEDDARLGARVVRVYARDWLKGSSRFAALLLQHLMTDSITAAGSGVPWRDTASAGNGAGEPSGGAEIEEGEEEDVLHPADDPEITGLDPEAEDKGGEEEKAIRPISKAVEFPRTGRVKHGGEPPRIRYRSPIDYRELMQSVGVKLPDDELTARYYRELALPWLIPFPKRIIAAATEPLPEGMEQWNLGEPLERIDWLESVIRSPHVVPGLTTVERTWGESPGADPEKRAPDLYLGIDCSGSMYNPATFISCPVLAGAIIALSALRAGARCQAILSGHPGRHSQTEGFVRDEMAILRTITGYLGTGFAFGIPHLKTTFGDRRPTDPETHILIVTDHDIFAMLGEAGGWSIAEQALASARGGGTFVLHMPLDMDPPQVKRLQEQGWAVHAITAWEDILPFAREFSRRKFGGDDEEARSTR